MDNPEYTEKKICDMDGFSGAKVELLQTATRKIVRKTGNIERNYEQLVLLKNAGYPVPAVFNKTGNSIDMEYVAGIDIKTYLCRMEVSKLLYFLCDIINKFKSETVDKDYSETYLQHLEFIEGDSHLPFKAWQLFERLPRILPSSMSHGDFTLENLLYTGSGFTLIDVSSGLWNSYVFDIAKMRQDLDGRWFLRGAAVDLSPQLHIIKETLQQNFPIAFDDGLYILMLLRVYKYCVAGSREFDLVLSEIKRIWK